MRVLLIWEQVPETTTLYALEGELAELAIEAAGYYINGEDNDAVLKLSERISDLECDPNYTALGHNECHEAFDVTGVSFDKVVIAGFIM